MSKDLKLNLMEGKGILTHFAIEEGKRITRNESLDSPPEYDTKQFGRKNALGGTTHHRRLSFESEFSDFPEDENLTPFSTTDTIIIPYNKDEEQFQFNSHDSDTLRNYSDPIIFSELTSLLQVINSTVEYRPLKYETLRPCWLVFLGKAAIFLLMAIILFILFYASLAVLYNPVLVILFLVFIVWFYRKIIIFEGGFYYKMTCRPLEKLIAKQNDVFYSDNGIEIFVGDKGRYIEVTFEKEIRGNLNHLQLSPRVSTPTERHPYTSGEESQYYNFRRQDSIEEAPNPYYLEPYREEEKEFSLDFTNRPNITNSSEFI